MDSKQTKILIVDDEELSLETTGDALNEEGYNVVATVDPSEALRLMRKHKPALVILDLEMPGMDGLTLLGRIREESQVPVLMLTGVDKSTTAVRALKIGAQDYLTKPLDIDKLLKTVELALATKTESNGRSIGKYHLEEELGRGGMGVVFRAFDPTLERKIAVKILLPELAADPEYESRFLREVRAAAKISHPAIVVVYEAAREGGTLYMAMEFVEGRALDQVLTDEKKFPQSEVCRIGAEVADGLHAAHQSGLVHRDVKPGNVMLTMAGQPKILDFGIARVQSADTLRGETGEFIGTLHYASPEQLHGRAVDARSDIYSLGMMLFELLLGEHPVPGDTPIAKAANVLHGNVRTPVAKVEGVSDELAKLIESMIAIETEKRPASMAVIATALRAVGGS